MSDATKQSGIAASSRKSGERMAQLAHGMGDAKGVRRRRTRETKSVGRGGLRGATGAYAGHAVLSEGSVAGRNKEHRWIRLFAKCGVLTLSNLHRKERYALHLTWGHLPTLREFPTQERIALRLKDRIPVTGEDSGCAGYGRSKAAGRNWGV